MQDDLCHADDSHGAHLQAHDDDLVLSVMLLGGPMRMIMMMMVTVMIDDDMMTSKISMVKAWQGCVYMCVCTHAIL